MFHVQRSEPAREIIAGSHSGPSLPRRFMKACQWRRIRAFFQEWSREGGALDRHVYNFWFEFDWRRRVRTVPVPSVFLGTMIPGPPCGTEGGEPLEDHRWLAGNALPLLLGGDLSPRTLDILQRALALLPPGSQVFQVGCMLARRPRSVRLLVKGVEARRLIEYVEELGWEGDALRVSETVIPLARDAGLVVLHLDLAGRVLPRIAFEFYLAAADRSAMRSGWELFLDHLEVRSLSSPVHRSALLSWPGIVTSRGNLRRWPRPLLEAARVLGPAAVGFFRRQIQHVKVVFEPGLPPRAMAYLLLFHCWHEPELAD